MRSARGVCVCLCLHTHYLIRSHHEFWERVNPAFQETGTVTTPHTTLKLPLFYKQSHHTDLKATQAVIFW